jgi:dolichyl-phosphate beta-glucosyltransferase
MYLSVIVPYYNEKEYIINNLIKINNFFENKFEFEVILVDDSGTKDFKNIYKKEIRNLNVIENDTNIGKGFSLKKGIKISKGELILLTDADLSTPIKEFEKLYSFYKAGYSVVIGSRNVINSNIKRQRPLKRKIVGRLFNILLRLILNLNFNDTQCGFKLFNSKILKNIITKSFVNRFCIDPELLYIANKKNLKIKEVGVEWSDNYNSSVNLKKDILNMFLDLIKIKYKH